MSTRSEGVRPVVISTVQHLEDTLPSREILEGQLRQSYGHVVLFHKTHEKTADILLSRLSRFRITLIVLAALSTAGFISTIFGTSRIGEIIELTISISLLTVSAYTKNYDQGEVAQKHKQTAIDLWFMRESFESLLVDVAMKEKPIEALQGERDKLNTRLQDIYKAAPTTLPKAQKQARQAL